MSTKHVAREFVCSIALLLMFLILSPRAEAQTTSATDGSTPLGLQPGAPAGSYPLSDFDNVNLFNGSLSFQLSLLGISGRGSAQLPLLLPVEGKWRVLDLATPQPNGAVAHLYMPVQSWWESNDRKYRPGSLIARQGSVDVMTCPDNTEVYSVTLTRLTFTSPDGTEYELRDQLTGGQAMGGAGCNYLNPPSRGTVFVTSDGSAATFVADTTIYDRVIAPNSSETYPSGYLMLRDGTRFRVESGNVTWMRDRNGNKFAFSYDSNGRIQTLTDSLNRIVTISRNTGPGTFDQITYKGFGGAPRVVKVNYSSLANALRADHPSTLTYKALFPELDGSSVSHHNPSVVSSVTLPNNQQYLFKYNPYGEIARVVLPTGGAVEYDYAAGAGVSASGAFGGGYEGSWVIYRRVTERRVYPAGGTGAAYASRMIYSRTEAECAGCVKLDQLNNSGVLLSRSKHYFHGHAALSFAAGPTEYAGWQEGREYKTEEFASDGATVLRRTVSTWQQPVSGSSWPLTQPETNAAAKTNNPQITQIETTLEPAQANKVSKQTFAFDKYANRTDVYEYDFGAGAAGSLVRRTHTDYLTANYDTLNPSTTNPDLNATSHIRNLPAQASIFDAAGIERARVSTEYDNYMLDGSDCLHSFHCPLLPRLNLSGFDPVFTASYAKRGNPTAVTRYLISNGAVTNSITSYSQYDVAGNVVRVLDPRSTLANNIATRIEYDDRYGSPNNEARANSAPSELTGLNSFALPTKVTNALGHTIHAQFDYYLGKPVNGEDANGVIASSYFNDPFDRPTQIRRAIGTSVASQTTFVYDDLNRVITTSADRDADGDNFLVSKVLFDQMGRTIETRRYEGGSNYIVTQTQYDALGRAFKTSNPFRPWQSESAVWTTQLFDALGRVISETTPDNAVVTTSYSGNSVTATDQAGKARKSVTDALGRLREVYEDPSGLNYQTSYLYDVLDNLRGVTQGSQQRFFIYDSLKRLLRVRNPEQGTLASLNLADSLTGNGAWSAGYQYDVSGNLTQKTDARGVVSTYAYDALNRNISIDYSDSTPDVGRQYDLAVNGKGFLNQVWQTGTTASTTYIDLYDVLGRPLVQRQRFFAGGVWSSSYQTSQTYNLAGAVTSQTYPSGHTVSYAYDAAGRTSSFSGNLGDGVSRSYASSFVYNSRSQLTQELLGTQMPLYHKLQYNIRGQLWDVRVATGSDVNGSWNRGCLQFFYESTYTHGASGPGNNGNVLKSNHYVPLDEQANTWAIHDQFYNYDSLNRLASVSEYYVSNTQPHVQQSLQSYAYDRWGNRTINAAQTWGVGINNKQFTVDPATNRLGVPNGQPGMMTYDNAGSLTTDTYSGAGSRTYDAENRMTTAADNTGQTSRYTYDADGRRVRRQVASGSEQWQIYGIDGELLAEYQAGAPASAAEKEYGYRGGQLFIAAFGVSTNGIKVQWLVPDHLGTPRIILDQTGALANVRRHDYLPFGEELLAPSGNRAAAQGYSSGDAVRQQFTSQERDTETGLDYFGARYYAPAQGRFTTIDPTLASASGITPQSWNRYAYVFNNPLSYIDPLGLWAIGIQYTYYEDGDKKGQVKSAKLVFTKTRPDDDATSLLKQLGYNPGDKGFDKLLKQVAAAIGGAEAVQSSKLGGDIGAFFGVIENKLRDQAEHERRNGTNKGGPFDADYQDCSMTACRLAYPALMALIEAGGIGVRNFGIDEADAMNAKRPTAPLNALRVRDIIRYGTGANRHFANVIFIGEDGVASIFSRTGERGKFERLQINDDKLLQRYGPITGSFRP